MPGAAGRTRAALEDRLLRPAPARPDEVNAPARAWVGHERDPVAPEPGRNRAVERVDPQLDTGDQIVDLPDPEQVAGPG